MCTGRHEVASSVEQTECMRIGLTMKSQTLDGANLVGSIRDLPRLTSAGQPEEAPTNWD